MKKIILIFTLCVLTYFTTVSLLCSGTIDGKFTALPGYKQITQLEQKQNKNINDYIKLTKLYHDFANDAKNIDVTDYVADKAEKIMNEHKTDATIIGYYGSILTLKARDSSNPVKKLTAVQMGTQYLDKAVQLDQNNIDVRILRGFNSYYLPSAFKRIKFTVVDFSFITQLFESNKITLSKELMSDIYCKLGSAYKRTGKTQKAIIAWRKSVTVATDKNSDVVREAQKYLAIYEN